MGNLFSNTTNLQALLEIANNLPEALELPDLTNPASQFDVLSGKEFIDANGNKLTGNFDITTPLAELNAANGGTAATTIGAAVDNAEAHASNQESLIAQIASALEGKIAGGGGSSGSSLPMCTVTIENEIWGGSNAIFTCYVNTIENGQLTVVSSQYSEPFSCAQGAIVIVTTTGVLNDVEGFGCEFVGNSYGGTVGIIIPHGSENATITFS